MATQQKTRQIKEIIKCGKDPVYFFNKYVNIQHPVKGRIPFKTFPFQNDCTQEFIDNRFVIVNKSRQLGLSTLTAAYSVWLALFQKDKNILVIATKLAVAQNFTKKTKMMIKGLPKWLVLPEIVSDNKQTIEFSNGSSIKAVPTSDDAGRSEALSLLIIDEAAFIHNFDTLWTGLYPTLTTGGRAVILSTPNGVGGQFHKLYTDAQTGENDFKPINLPWDVHPEHDDEWFKMTTNNLSKRQTAQEYLCDFASSGAVFLADDDIEWVSTSVKAPIEREGPQLNVWVWKQPLSEHKYIVSADVSRGDSKDFSTFHVIDVDTGEVVAEYQGKIPPDRYGELLFEYGLKYNNALMCPENNSYGYATILKLQDMKYPNMYYRNRKGVYIGDYTPEQDSSVAGFTTSGKTRPQILTKLEETIRNKNIIIYSSRFYAEMKTFAWKGNKAQALKGYNDDLIMSLAIGIWLYDGSSDGGAKASAINDAMLASMKKTSTQHSTNKIETKMSNTKIIPIKQNGIYTDGTYFSTKQGRVDPMFDWMFKK